MLVVGEVEDTLLLDLRCEHLVAVSSGDSRVGVLGERSAELSNDFPRANRIGVRCRSRRRQLEVLHRRR